MGEGNRYSVSGIAALILLTFCQSCGNSQNYIETPASLGEEADYGVFLESVYPTVKRPPRQAVRRSEMVEPGSALRVACVGESSRWFVGQIQQEFEASHSGSEIRLLEPGIDLGLEDLQGGNLDLLLTTRSLLYRQKKLGLRQTVVGHETWVAVVNRGNPLADVSHTDLIRILNGEIREWSQLAPWSVEVQPVILDLEDANQGEPWSSLFPDQDLRPRGEGEPDWAQVLSRVSRIPGSIAIVPLEVARSSAIKVLRVDGKSPDYRSLQDGSYPLGFDVYITYSVDSQSRTRELMDWLIANKSQLMASAKPGR